MVSNDVLIISSQETFSVHGLKAKLNEIGYSSQFVRSKMKDLQDKANDGKLIVYYMDENVTDDQSFLVYLKDLCMEKEKELILIGKKVEYDAITKTIPEGCISEWFERPLDMYKFLDAVRAHMDKMHLMQMRKTILIVDDDVSYMQMVREWLKDTYQVVMVNSGIKAIRWLTINKADLVLLDFEMPVTTGPQILEMLKSEDSMETVPVMFLTGQQSRASVMRAMKLNPVDYLLKSIGRAALKDKLDQYFALQKAGIS